VNSLGETQLCLIAHSASPPSQLDDSQNVIIFHAGTTIKDKKFITNGGRVVAISAVAATKEEARKLAYEK
jgi:phosphoribosylamine--glycine ligase